MVRVWDLESGEPVLGPLTAHDGGVYAVAAGERNGRPVIISGGRPTKAVRFPDVLSRTAPAQGRLRPGHFSLAASLCRGRHRVG
jgi:hypothetical protein